MLGRIEEAVGHRETASTPMIKRTAVLIKIVGFIVIMFSFNMAMNVVSQGMIVMSRRLAICELVYKHGSGRVSRPRPPSMNAFRGSRTSRGTVRPEEIPTSRGGAPPPIYA